QQLKIRVYFDITTSRGILTMGSFVFKDCRGRIAVDADNPFSLFSSLAPLDEGNYYFMTLQEPKTSTQLNLIYGDFGGERNPTADELQQSDHLPTLGSTPSRYDLLYPHQFYQFALQAPFFYQDDERTYFVSPENLWNAIHSFL